MDLIDSHLNDAITFVNDHLRQRKSKDDCDKWCHIISNDILILDEMSNLKIRRLEGRLILNSKEPKGSANLTNKKEIIIALQNVLHQLDYLLDEQKPPILISNTYKIRSYLPVNENSLYALGNAFQTHSIKTAK